LLQLENVNAGKSKSQIYAESFSTLRRRARTTWLSWRIEITGLLRCDSLSTAHFVAAVLHHSFSLPEKGLCKCRDIQRTMLDTDVYTLGRHSIHVWYLWPWNDLSTRNRSATCGNSNPQKIRRHASLGKQEDFGGGSCSWRPLTVTTSHSHCGRMSAICMITRMAQIVEAARLLSL